MPNGMRLGLQALVWDESEANMSYRPKILAFAGSTRKDSFNKKLVAVVAQAARAAGADVNLIDLKEFGLPVYDGDDEAAHGLPDNARKLKQLFLAHDGLLISSPEYNGSYPGGLKNVFDWVSRPVAGGKPLAEFEGKVCAIMAASPGALGGMRMLPILRLLLSGLLVTVIPEQLALGTAKEAFNEDGTIKDAAKHKSAAALGEKVAMMITRLKS